MMKGWATGVAVFLGLAVMSGVAQRGPVTSLSTIHSMTNAQAVQHVPVDFEASVTYYRDYEGTLFVQDGDVAIYVHPNKPYPLVPGDRIRIQGMTEGSFRPYIANASITLLHHGAPLKAHPASFVELLHAQFDCQLVSIRGRVLAADIMLSSDRRYTNLQLLADGGEVGVQVESGDAAALSGLLDAEVEVSGAVSGRFDGKMEMTGIVLHTQSLDSLKVLTPGSSPWSGPVIPMDEIFSQYDETLQSHRVRVEGTVTYYAPGSVAVLENGTKSLWVNTRTRGDLRIGDKVDATGFPDVHDGFLKLTDGEFTDSQTYTPVIPMAVTWKDLASSHHVFDLVSTEARVVAEVREGGQDEYVLMSDGHLFSAILRHPERPLKAVGPEAPMKDIAQGSKVRVTGVCILEDSNPFNAEVPFDLLLRSFDDVEVVAPPSLVSVANLVRLVSVLVIVVLGVGTWGWMLNRKLQRQTVTLAWQAKTEAAKERRNALVEQRRSRILEDINGTRPLAEVLEEITELVSFLLNGAPCWCEVTDGARLGTYQAEMRGRTLTQSEIPARMGMPLGMLYVAIKPGLAPESEQEPALFLGTRLATLAMETRRLYSDLVHRSEFDLLTDLHNRFSLDQQLQNLMARARETAGIFGLIYVDLDEFKQVNDVYGHHVGDLYLQEVAARMKKQLRGADLLARLGGDEFAALVQARNRDGVEEISQRIEHCFDEPFCFEGYVIHGTASVGIAVYPDDGTTKDSLLSVADAAMYVRKHIKGQADVASRTPTRTARDHEG